MNLCDLFAYPGLTKSILHNASSGAIFSDYKFYFSDFPHKPKKIWYDDIKTVFVSRKRRKSQETEDFISIELTNGTVYKWHCASVNMQPIADFLSEMKEVLKQKKSIVFPGLGRLRSTKENNFFFVADEDLDIYPEGFGLEPISLKTQQM